MNTLPPLKPYGQCSVCHQPFEYEKNPNWENIKHLFKKFPERGYWIPIIHPNCENRQDETLSAEKESERQMRVRKEVERDLVELGFARIIPHSADHQVQVHAGIKHAYDALNNWIANTRGILLMGKPGRGKSHLMASHGAKWSAAGLTVAYQSVGNLLGLLRTGFEDQLHDERLRFVSTRVDLLMLDDLGAERRTDWSEEKLYLILDARLKIKKSLFVTTNLTEAELYERYHPRIASRLKEMCHWIHVDGQDWRQIMQQAQGRRITLSE